MNPKLVSVLSVLILINSQWTQCDNDFENERGKRTVGIFFRSFIDAFQTQRQPAPNVVSFKPSKQVNRQSIKADILSSSKTLVLQKPSLLKTSIPISITRAPKVAVPKTTTTTPPHPTLHPKAPAEHITQVPLTQPQATHPNSPLDPLPNPVLPFDQHPLIPLKTQIHNLPFQTHHVPEIPFIGFGLQSHHQSGISPLNYQAEIYLHNPVGGIPPSAGNPSGPYSPDNGWHDVEEIFSKGINTPSLDREKVEAKNEEFGNKYEANIKPESGDKYCVGNPTSAESLPYHSNTCHENKIDDQRIDGHYQNYRGGEFGGLHYLPPQLFVPYVTHSDLIGNPSGNNYRGLEENSHGKSRSFHQLFDEAFKKLAPEGFNVKLEPQAVQDRARVSDVGVLRNRSWSENTNLVNNKTYQQSVDVKVNENFEEKYDHNVQNHIHYPEQNNLFSTNGLVYLPEHKQVHYSEHSAHLYENVLNTKLINDHIANLHNYYYNNYEKDHIQDVQGHTSIGNLPSGYRQTGDQHPHSPDTFHNPSSTYDSSIGNLPSGYRQTGDQQPHSPATFHNPSSTYDSNSDYTEINNLHANGYYHFKRSYKRQA